MLVRQAESTSALARSLDPDAALWGIAEHLLATVADELALANWQRQGKRSARKPKPIPRPGRKGKEQHIGRDPLPLVQLDRWIAEREDQASESWPTRPVGPSGVQDSPLLS